MNLKADRFRGVLISTCFYSSPNIIRIIKSRRMRWAGHVARMGEKRNAYRILAGKPEGKRPLGRPRRRWVDNIKIDLREQMWEPRILTTLWAFTACYGDSF
jgi:hypothetical protein